MRRTASVGALIFLIALAFFAHQRFRPSAPLPWVEAEIGEARFRFSPAFAHDEETRIGGAVKRLDFLAAFPDFSPPKAAARGESATPPEKLVFLTISPRDEAIDPAEPPSRLYERFLEAEAVPAPGGLVRRRFEKGTRYDLQELYLAPPDGRRFSARCPRSWDETPAASAPCLFFFRDGALDIEVRFHPSLLAQWESLNEGARRFYAALLAAAPARGN